MTTITLQEDIRITKTNFSSIEELKIFIFENYWYPNIKEEDFDIDFREINKNELTDKILQSVEETKKIPKYLLHNI